MILRFLIAFGIVIAIGFLVPERIVVPVDGASSSDWNPDSFWYEPWGVSGVHKGIDIFAPHGTNVRAATGGLVLYSGTFSIGGNVIVVLGPKWRAHYYAHLDSSQVSLGSFVSAGSAIGAVGDSGNAAGKPPHLHYVILSPFPYPWNFSSGTQGWKRMFYLDPGRKLRAASGN